MWFFALVGEHIRIAAPQGYAYDALFYDFQVMIVAILATRMHLYLWQMNRHPYRSGALVRIPISDASSAHFTM
jgi:hypothetical protein